MGVVFASWDHDLPDEAEAEAGRRNRSDRSRDGKRPGNAAHWEVLFFMHCID